MTDHTTDPTSDDTRLIHTTIARLMIEIRGVSVHQTEFENTELTDDSVLDDQPEDIVESIATPSDTETQIALRHNRLSYSEYRSICEDIMSITAAEPEHIAITSYIKAANQIESDSQTPARYTPRFNIILNTTGVDITVTQVDDTLSSLFRVYSIEDTDEQIIAQTDATFLDIFADIPDKLGLSDADITLAARAVE